MIPVVAGSNPVGHPTPPPGAPLHWRAPAVRGETPQAAFRAVARAALEQIEANARGMLASDDPEYLHQLRVGVRRLHSALRAFRALLDRKEARRVARSLRKLTPKLGAARDWDVLVGRLERAGAVAMLADARHERDAARGVARRALLSRRFSRLPARVSALTTAESDLTLAQFGAEALGRAHGKLMKRSRGADWSDAAERHAIRIRLKRLRYAAEFFAAAFPNKADAYIASLKELQDILGELNDIAVGRRLIGFEADESALLRRLDVAWTRFARRPGFWRAAA